MSFMPDIGTRVLRDGREAVVVNIDPLGEEDRVIFDDDHEEVIDQFDIVGFYEWNL